MLSRIFLLVVCSLFLIQTNQAQNYVCGTVSSDEAMSILRMNKKNAVDRAYAKMDEVFIPVQFNLVGDAQGNGRIDEITMYEAICNLNERYEGTNIRFYINGFTYLDNGFVHEHLNGLTQTGRRAVNDAKHPNALNVFMVQEPGQGVAGYYTGGLDIVMMRNTATNDSRYTLEHELGHFFSLAHTHIGWDQIEQRDGNGNIIVPFTRYNPNIHGDTVTITTITSNQGGTTQVELVDGSNCNTAGDMICDTPPDYGFGFTCNCCRMTFDVWDRNGDKIEPMIDNVMSYSDGCMPYRFSEEQVTVMHADIASARRTYLRTGEVNTYDPIVTETVIHEPIFGDRIETYNGVNIEWEAVANAEAYIIRIEGSNADNNVEVQLTETQYYAEELEPNDTYFVSVYPISKFGINCAANASVTLFETGSGTTNIEEIENGTIEIFPNPVSKGQSIKLVNNLTSTEDSSLRIIDLSGKVLHSTKLISSNRTQEINISKLNLDSGIYLVEIENNSQQIIKRIIVE